MSSKRQDGKGAPKKSKKIREPEPEPIDEEELVDLPDDEEVDKDDEEVENVEDEEEEENSAEENGDKVEKKKKKKTRKIVNQQSVHKDLDAIVEHLNSSITTLESKKNITARQLKGIRNKVKAVQKNIPRCLKTKNKNGTKKVSGFILPCKITDELADFLGVPRGTQLSRTEVTNGMCVYIKLRPDEKRETMLRWKHLNPDGKRDLQNPKNKMIILPDEPLKKLLRYSSYVEDVKKGLIKKRVKNPKTNEYTFEVVTSTDLYYWSAQYLIKGHFLETMKTGK